MRLSSEAATQRPAIERMAKYVKDDGAIASYFRIPRHEVQAIRDEMPSEEPRRFAQSRTEPTDASDGSGAYRSHCRDMESRSRDLRDACLNYFRRFEKHHRLQEREGMIAVLYGWDTLENARRAAA